MEMKEVQIIDGKGEVRTGLIPELDGYRGSATYRNWNGVSGFGDEQTALECEIDDYLREWTRAIEPYTTWLAESGEPDPAKEAVNRALTVRNQQATDKTNRIEAAKRVSAMVPRYKELQEACKEQGLEFKTDVYVPENVWITVPDDDVYCIDIVEGGYRAGFGDGYHRDWIDDSPTIVAKDLKEGIEKEKDRLEEINRQEENK